MDTPEQSLARLRRGAAQILSEAELLSKLREGRPLNIKLGVDPSTPDLHLGHTIALQKLRDFQDMGHQAVLIIGDFTAMIGDPSGKSATRPQLSHDAVMANAKTYQEQAFKILDPNRLKTVFNGEWFEIMPFEEVIRLNSRVTLQQMLQREDFRERMERGAPVHAHELQYPIMQGWDSVKVRADVELGGTDQLFNIMVGRSLQKEEKLPQQVAFMLPILEGLDGTQKMSKSLGNYVALNDPPKEMFGKLMSIPDDLMSRYYLLLLGEETPTGHPMDAKKELARKITTRYHSATAAADALEDFNTRFSKRDLDHAELPEISVAGVGGDIVSVVVAAYAQGFGQTRSRGDVRRLVEQGSVQLSGEKVSDPKAAPVFTGGEVLRLDKTRAVRVRAA